MFSHTLKNLNNKEQAVCWCKNNVLGCIPARDNSFSVFNVKIYSYQKTRDRDGNPAITFYFSDSAGAEYQMFKEMGY